MNKLPIFQIEKSSKFRFRTPQAADSSLFGYFLSFCLFIIFFLLFLRLFQLTVVKGNFYWRLAEDNRIRELLIEPQRGKIIDRKGVTIAESEPADTSSNDPRLTSRRLYQQGEAVAPLIGYQQLADQTDLDQDRCLYKLHLGDKIGKRGVERFYDCDLRGQAGEKLIEVDAKGKFLKTLAVDPPQSGKTIQLALDLDLQKKAFELLQGKKGAIVGLKPATGEILIMASSPSFDPAVFTSGDHQQLKKIIEEKDKPLFNRAAEGTYPPGSIFKLVIAASALEEHAIDEKTQVEDTGILHAGSLTFGNWYFLQYGKTEGMVDIVKAIRRSNDIFFYKTGEKVGPDKIKSWAERFGFGHPTEFGLTESAGLIPSPFWKEETLHDRWYTGDTYNFAIGQGYMLVTPLQVAAATAVFANGGYLCQPQLLKILNPKSKIQTCKKLPISEKTLSLIKQGMKEACSPGGTGWPLFNFKILNPKSKIEEKDKNASDSANLTEIQTACKTGTAEAPSENKNPHAWFTVYAPAEKPEIVLTVLLEEAGQGSDVAGPVAKHLLTTYFEK